MGCLIWLLFRGSTTSLPHSWQGPNYAWARDKISWDFVSRSCGLPGAYLGGIWMHRGTATYGRIIVVSVVTNSILHSYVHIHFRCMFGPLQTQPATPSTILNFLYFVFASTTMSAHLACTWRLLDPVVTGINQALYLLHIVYKVQPGCPWLFQHLKKTLRYVNPVSFFAYAKAAIYRTSCIITNNVHDFLDQCYQPFIRSKCGNIKSDYATFIKAMDTVPA